MTSGKGNVPVRFEFHLDMFGARIVATVLLLARLNISEGVSDNICRRSASNGKPSCYNIYRREKERSDILVLNAPLGIETYGSKALEGRTVRVIADNMLPYITSNNYSKVLGGYLGDIWNIIQEALKFQSDIISVDYDRGLELMSQGKAEIMLAAAVEKPGLVNIEYSQPYFYNWYYLYMKRPTPKASSSSYLKTFDSDLWVATGSLVIILAGSLWLTTKMLYVERKYEHNLSIVTCLIIVCGGFLNQGFDIKLKSYSARIQVFLAFVIGYLLYSAMNAVLVARLAIFEVELPFNSLSDISEKQTHSLCLRTNSFVYNNFTYTNRTVLPKWKSILNGPGCLDINNQTNLARSLCNDGVIFLENWVVMSTVIRNYKISCDVTFHNQQYFKKANSFLLLESFKEKVLIHSFMKRLKGTGVLKRLESKWIIKDFPNNIHSTVTSYVTMHHITGILITYTVLMFISLILLVIEFIYMNMFDEKVQFIP